MAKAIFFLIVAGFISYDYPSTHIILVKLDLRVNDPSYNSIIAHFHSLSINFIRIVATLSTKSSRSKPDLHVAFAISSRSFFVNQ